MSRLLAKLNTQPKSLWVRYSLPFLGILAALLLQGLLQKMLPGQPDFPYAFFYLVAVFAVAWVGGYGPGVVTCLIVMIGLPLALVRHIDLLKVDPSRLLLLVLVSVLVSAVAQSQRRSRARLSEANEELDQRVQNRTQDLAQAVEALQLEVVQRKQTEVELNESKGRVDFALDAAGIGRWDLDLASGKITRTARYDQIFGYETLQPEWTYQTFLQHVVPADRAAAEERFTAALERNEPYDFDCRVLQADDEPHWVWVQGKILRDASGKAISLLGGIRNITRRKLSEQKLRTQVDRLNLLDQITRAIGERQDLRSIFQVVIRSLEDRLPIDFGCICLYDPVVQTLTVTSVGVRSETLAMDLAMTNEARIEIDENGLSRCVRGHLVYEQDVSEVPFPFPQRLARGGLRALVAAPLLVESKVFGVLIAARRQEHSFNSADCEFLRQLSEHVALAANQAHIYTALEQAYNDLRQTQQAVMQQERLRALGQMASGIAHDINNAISPIVLYTDMLLAKEQTLTERGRQQLETIQRAADDVAHTVARLREVYRQQDEQMELAPVDLGSLVQHVLDLTRARWNDMPQKLGIMIRLQNRITPHLPAISGIESEIRQALTNLVLNAVDAMPEGGTLTVRALFAQPEAGKPRVVIEIEDTGIGMDEETRRRCLEPFFTTKGERGTGLGLAMVYGIAQRHGAGVEIESARGQGTTIRLNFPVPISVAAAKPSLASASAVPSRLRILVVDDDPLLIKSLRDSLESDGHAVITANGGREGIEIFQTEVGQDRLFDIVITDLGMPNVDGRKVAAAVKAARASTPLILLTGWGQRLVADGEIPPCVDKVLSKPPKPQELRAALAELTTQASASAAG